MVPAIPPPVLVPPRLTVGQQSANGATPVPVQPPPALPPLQMPPPGAPEAAFNNGGGADRRAPATGVSPGGMSGLSTGSAGGREPVLCQSCGQTHDPTTSHLYDYVDPIDADLLCTICRQPLVDPLDTKCGHTFCSPCLKNHLAVQALCPKDKQIINYLECQQASNIVKRLLEKLLVVCPNVDHCEEVLQRCELESHLLYWCRGAIVPCPNSKLGCTYQGPRTSHLAHKGECRFQQRAAPPPVAAEGANGGHSVVSPVSGNKTTGRSTVRFDPIPSEHLYSTGGRPALPEGEVTTVEILLGSTQTDLGISFVGGIDTPLMCIIIQEIYLTGVIAKDGRLRPGDQLLEVNGEDLTQCTHHQARAALSMPMGSICRLTVYREKAEEAHPAEKEEIIRINLTKRHDKRLGIKLVGKKNRPGLYILGLVPDGIAELDGRLKKDDRILEINGADLREGSQDHAADIIKSAADRVSIVVSRIARPQTPDLIRTASGENLTDCAAAVAACSGSSTVSAATAGTMSLSTPTAAAATSMRKQSLVRPCREQVVTVEKQPGESLGMSVAGGVNSQRGDTPVYVTNLSPDGVLGRTRQINRGDILLAVNEVELLGLSHERAVDALKTIRQNCAEVTVRLLEGPESGGGLSAAGGNFMPSWLYWLQLPRYCQIPRAINLPRDPSGSLGFSIVGGNDCCLLQAQMSPPGGRSNSSGPAASIGTIGGGGAATGMPQPIVVKSIVPGSPAHRDGRLKCGDILLSVNRHSLADISHAHAVSLLKHVRGEVQLQVVSWPGTIV